MISLDFKNSFDTTGSLAALYLWLMFGYLNVLLNCDLQRSIHQSQVLRHLLGIIAFYFLFTVIDPNNNVPVWVTLVKTVGVYVLFVLATKSRWYFAGTALLLLFIDQLIKNHIAYVEKQDEDGTVDKRAQLQKVRSYLLYAIVTVIFAGTMEYTWKQMRDKKDAFRWKTLFLGTGRCSR
jgi:hypothetical protein